MDDKIKYNGMRKNPSLPPWRCCLFLKKILFYDVINIFCIYFLKIQNICSGDKFLAYMLNIISILFLCLK